MKATVGELWLTIGTIVGVGLLIVLGIALAKFFGPEITTYLKDMFKLKPPAALIMNGLTFLGK